MNTMRFLQQKQAAEQQRQMMLSSLLSPDTPMNLIMDPRVPLSDQDRQNLWNQRAANQWSQRQQGPTSASAEANSASALISKYTQMSGSLNPERNYGLVTGSPEWQQLDNKSRVGVISQLFGNEKATGLQNQILDQDTIEKQRRQQFDDAYAMRQSLLKNQLESSQRYAGTERDMLARNLTSGDWLVRPEGVLERNPQYNSSNAQMNPNIPQYVGASPDTQGIIFRNWNQVRPNAPVPLNPEIMARMQFMQQNPSASSDQALIAGRQAVPNYSAPIGPQLTNSLNAPAVPQTPRNAYQLGQGLRTGITPQTGGIGSELMNYYGQANRAALQAPATAATYIRNAAAGLSNEGFVPAVKFARGLFGAPDVPTQPTPYVNPDQTTDQYYPDWLKNYINYK